jgi:hypothetical protein
MRPLLIRRNSQIRLSLSDAWTVVRPPVAQGDDPYGELAARCRNRFDDRFKYVFVIGN